MRNVEAHLLEDKMDDAVTHYINSHQSEPVHIDTNGIPMTVQDDGAGRVTVMHQQTYTTQMCRQVSVTEQVGDGPWGEELLEGPIAAIVAHLQNTRHPPPHHKEQQGDSIVVQLPPMQTLPPLQDMKRCADTDWFTDKNKKDDASLLQDSNSQMLEMNANSSPAQNKQNKKSLPHKKRISKKLKRNNGNTTPQQEEVVVINCSESVPQVEQEQILPDNYGSVHHSQHIPHEVRPMYICQICGDYYGDEQLKFYHHLKQHYEPHGSIIIDNPVPDLTMDKMSNNCIVDNVATLPDSIVELSLENTVPKTIYQPIDKHILFTSADKTLTYNNKMQYSMACIDKEPPVSNMDTEKSDLYETLEKLELYNCGKCTRTFRKQRQCEAHMREAHSNTKCEEMEEFSEPEDLMAGIQVCVSDETYECALLPHLTVENGHVHQDHNRPSRGPCGQYCATCAKEGNAPLKLFKEEVLQRIFDGEVSESAFRNIMSDHDNMPEHEHEHAHEHGHDHGHEHVPEHEQEHVPAHEHEHVPEHDPGHVHEQVDEQITDEIPEHEQRSEHGNESQDCNDSEEDVDKEKGDSSGAKKRYTCGECSREFVHRNSLLYHALSHAGKQHACRDCDKSFYTHTALKVHKRVHNGDRPYKCDLCDREFRQWSDLNYHKISLHSDKKHFKCEYCGKEFARKYSLNLHVRIHTGEKNYKCLYCTKTFRASSYRLTHMRTHTGDRPYSCVECNKCFRSAFDLRRHMLVHDKMRNKLDDVKHKQNATKTKMTDTKEEKPESPPKDIKKEPTQQPQAKRPSRTKKTAKKGAPNVTVSQNRDEFKSFDQFTDHVPVIENRQEFNKYKDVYSESAFKNQITVSQTDFATLRPVHRPDIDYVDNKPVFRENTDGKMQVYTHTEKGTLILDRNIERDPREGRSEMVGDGESAFLERLTALYNIPAV